ncbi:MAG: hypothetical protein ACPLTR_10530 [Thermacetogeniaceae bacterium]
MKRRQLALVKPALSPEKAEEYRQAAVSQILRSLSRVVSALIDEAEGGDVRAARLLFEACGLLSRGPAAMQVVNTQVTITPDEIERLERALRDEDY